MLVLQRDAGKGGAAVHGMQWSRVADAMLIQVEADFAKQVAVWILDPPSGSGAVPARLLDRVDLIRLIGVKF